MPDDNYWEATRQMIKEAAHPLEKKLGEMLAGMKMGMRGKGADNPLDCEVSHVVIYKEEYPEQADEWFMCSVHMKDLKGNVRYSVSLSSFIEPDQLSTMFDEAFKHINMDEVREKVFQNWNRSKPANTDIANAKV